MANPNKGELAFEAAGKTYTLRYSMNELAQIEEALNISHVTLFERMQEWGDNPEKIRLRPLIVLFWAGLLEHNPEIDVRAAGELIVPAGGTVKVIGLVTQALVRAFPPPPAETKGARPPMQSPDSPGTGSNALSTG